MKQTKKNIRVSSNKSLTVREEIKRRTRLAGLFPNEASLLSVIGAILMVTDEQGQTCKRYLNVNVENKTTVSSQNKIYRKNVRQSNQIKRLFLESAVYKSGR